MVKPVAAGPEVTGVHKDGSRGVHKDGSRAKLEKTCSEFESIFITYMLKSMSTTIDDDPFLGNDNESKIIKSMFNENLSQRWGHGNWKHAF
ncbi:MAG: hypothetical protein JRC89_05205 [Deltaproteobacteria bacterium]|nr:hypothetical protein [Deltaproteobacteria bacterium]